MAERRKMLGEVVDPGEEATRVHLQGANKLPEVDIPSDTLTAAGIALRFGIQFMVDGNPQGRTLEQLALTNFHASRSEPRGLTPQSIATEETL